jgi:hypothetical protein
MAYPFPYYGQQPFQYQDQLNQLRSAPMTMPSAYQPTRSDPTGLNWVQGEAGAKSWIVAPGATVLLMDSEAQRFYLKSADLSGVPALRTFEYAEVGAEKPAAATQQTGFVTADEFDKFKKEVLCKLEELSEPVEVSLSRKKKGEVNE